MYRLLIKQFFRSKTTWIAFIIVLFLGITAIAIGKQFLDQQHDNISKTLEKQEKHIENQIPHHPDDLGYLMYYIKFMYINKVDNLAGIAIGQRDLNSNIQSVGMLNLENQKYNTDLVNPLRLQVGNLDLSFVVIFLFPLVIIALTFNLLSEEVENGTWKMIKIQGKSSFLFLLLKLSIRFLFVFIVLTLLFTIAKWVMNITVDARFIYIVLLSLLYIIFWFSISLLIISFQKNSNFNAISLLTLWLVLVVLLPVSINKYITNKYPIGEALSMTIKQRDGYHKKWDTDKKATMDKFYDHYPQYRKYGVIEEGFNWLWYYAMQQMGDDESQPEREAMLTKVYNRQEYSTVFADFIPPIKVQLAISEIAQTDLKNYLGFLNATTAFHEKIRLDFYPKIFSEELPATVDWKKYRPEFYDEKSKFNFFRTILPIVFLTLCFLFIGLFKLKKV